MKKTFVALVAAAVILVAGAVGGRPAFANVDKQTGVQAHPISSTCDRWVHRGETVTVKPGEHICEIPEDTKPDTQAGLELEAKIQAIKNATTPADFLRVVNQFQLKLEPGVQKLLEDVVSGKTAAPTPNSVAPNCARIRLYVWDDYIWEGISDSQEFDQLPRIIATTTNVNTSPETVHLNGSTSWSNSYSGGLDLPISFLTLKLGYNPTESGGFSATIDVPNVQPHQTVNFMYGNHIRSDLFDAHTDHYVRYWDWCSLSIVDVKTGTDDSSGDSLKRMWPNYYAAVQ